MVADPEDDPHERLAEVAEAAEALAELGTPAAVHEGTAAAGAPDVEDEGGVHSQLLFTPAT